MAKKITEKILGLIPTTNLANPPKPTPSYTSTNPLILITNARRSFSKATSGPNKPLKTQYPLQKNNITTQNAPPPHFLKL
ncbi:hypothetical protein PCASD_25679 [Puccinia coronata f. sp. avenae]|uniref:Uncharacterized protein n=1 Tax=Puccinia coronata f. sp. avenae TaxID=200324 RepID=A0A2N5S4G7_9BASI|nr:hypothetical protein PCASD_25679 [Puccinia coronata f. sp. avenae]